MTLTDRFVALLIAVVALLMVVGAGSVIPHRATSTIAPATAPSSPGRP